MSTTKKLQEQTIDSKSEFLAELISKRNYWKKKDTEECDTYAQAYERLIHAFTQPETE